VQVVHEPKTKVDLQKCIENHSFAVDTVFDERTSNTEVYDGAIAPLVQAVCSKEGCAATAFACQCLTTSHVSV
jgi:hypothetical protein